MSRDQAPQYSPGAPGHAKCAERAAARQARIAHRLRTSSHRHNEWHGLSKLRGADGVVRPAAPPIPLDARELEPHITCPSCRAPMDVHPYYGPGNIVIDTCRACDLIWLDHGELKQITDAPGRDRGTRAAMPAAPVTNIEPRAAPPVYQRLVGLA